MESNQSADNKSFGQWLKRVRKARGFTQREVGRLSGLSSAMITRLESGDVGHTVATIEKLVTALAESPEHIPAMLEEAKAASVGIALAPATERDPLLNQLANLSPERWEVIRALLLSWSEEPPQPS